MWRQRGTLLFFFPDDNISSFLTTKNDENNNQLCCGTPNILSLRNFPLRRAAAASRTLSFTTKTMTTRADKGGDDAIGITARRAMRKHTILSLPLVEPHRRLTNSLLADPLTPHPASLLSVEASSPSLLRRSRGVGEGAHFTYVSPLTLSFPYDLPADEAEEARRKAAAAEDNVDEEKMTPEERQELGMKRAREGMERVERLMRPFEIHPDDVASQAGKGEQEQGDQLQRYLPKARQAQTFPSARLLALSRACLDDCLPALDVGDSEAWIKSHNGKDGPDCYSSGPMAKAPGTDEERARFELSDFLSGRLVGAQMPSSAVLAKADEEHGAELGVAEAKHQRIVRQTAEESAVERFERRKAELGNRTTGAQSVWQGYAPWANAYSGHQFGVWAGQLGDGRAISLFEVLNTTNKQRWEMQLKGAGRTPYSRFADGLATLGSSVREFLCSEHLAALGVPTSRALAVTSLPDVIVSRERRHAAAICTRLAPIWTRIGSFEHHADRKEWESVRLLAEFVAREGYGWPVEASKEEGKREAFVGKLVLECARRNAEMIAHWQVQGFMHGVMNTDNISLLGITIDFGPYAMMDLFDQSQICNKSDGEGRYTYRMQPTMGLFALEKLLEAVSPLVGYEQAHGQAPSPGVLVRATAEEIAQWGAKGQESLSEELKTTYMTTTLDAWKKAWLYRLGIQVTETGNDREEVIDPLLSVLEECDFTTTLRRLCEFAAEPAQDAESFATNQWIDWARVPEYLRDTKRDAARRFLQAYSSRLRAIPSSETRLSLKELQARNPAFVLRNWVTEEVVKRLEEKDDTDFLESVLAYCVDPYKEPSSEEEKVSFTILTWDCM